MRNCFMAKMSEVIQARLAAYGKMEEYGKMDSKGNRGFNEILSIFSKEEGLFCYCLLHFLFLALFAILALFAMMLEVILMEKLTSITNISLGLPIFIGNLVLFYFSFFVFLNKKAKVYKREEKEKVIFKKKAKELKVEMDALFVIYDDLLENLDVDEYISKTSSFFDNLSNQEILVLKEYKSRRKKAPSNDLVEFFNDDKRLRNKSQIEIFND